MSVMNVFLDEYKAKMEAFLDQILVPLLQIRGRNLAALAGPGGARRRLSFLEQGSDEVMTAERKASREEARERERETTEYRRAGKGV